MYVNSYEITQAIMHKFNIHTGVGHKKWLKNDVFA